MHGVAERVPHRDAALHGGDRGEHQHAGAVAGGVDAARRGARDPVDLDVAAVVERDAGLLEAEAGGVRDRARPPSGSGCPRPCGRPSSVTTTPSPVRRHRRGARDCDEHRHAAPLEDVLEHLRRRPRPRRAAPGRGCETSVTSDAERGVGGGELGAGHARSRPRSGARAARSSVVDLLPGQDPLAVGLGARAAPAGAHRSRRARVGLEPLLAAVGRRRRPARGPSSRPRAADDAHALAARAGAAMSSDCAVRERLTRALTAPRSTLTEPPAALARRAARRARRTRPCRSSTSAVAIRVLLTARSR